MGVVGQSAEIVLRWFRLWPGLLLVWVCVTAVPARCEEPASITDIDFRSEWPLEYVVLKLNDPPDWSDDYEEKIYGRVVEQPPPFCGGDMGGEDSVYDAVKTALVQLKPGTIVGVAYSDGRCSRIQYIGPDKVITGWMYSVNSAPWMSSGTAPRVSVDVGWKVRHQAHPSSVSVERLQQQQRVPAGEHFTFAMRSGQSTPVCEAFLQRLHRTLFYLPPTDGIPENTDVPGFDALPRRWVPIASANAIARSAEARTWDSLEGAAPPPQVGLVVEDTETYTWEADGGVDVNNDGHKRRLVLSEDQGSAEAWDVWPSRRGAMPLILRGATLDVDRQSTFEVFGTPAPLGGTRFPRISGIFRYHGKTYFVEHTSDRDDSQNIDTLKVWSRQDNKSVENCTYVPRRPFRLLKDRGDK